MGVTGKEGAVWIFQVHIVPHNHVWQAIISPPCAKGSGPLICARQFKFHGSIGETAIRAPFENYIRADAQNEYIHIAICIDVDWTVPCGINDFG